MNNLKKALLAVSVVGLGSFISAPAFAQTYASGSSTIVLMNGASQSVGAEISLPQGTFFTGGNSNGPVTGGQVLGAVVVTPLLETPGVPIDGESGLAINEQNFAELIVDPGLPDSLAALTTPGATSFSAAAAAQLQALDSTDPAQLAAIVSIIRAGAGVDGLD